MTFFDHAPWYLAGPALGLAVVLLQWIGNLHLGVTGSVGEFQRWLLRKREYDGWRVLFFFGLLGGGLLHAAVSGSFEAGFAYAGLDRLVPTALGRFTLLTAAGVLIGFGARTAGGCTSGHGLCGMSRGSGASLLTTMTFMGTAVAIAHAVSFFGGCPMKLVGGLLVGVYFGFILGWTRFFEYEVIMDALLFRDWYLWATFGSAVATGWLGLRGLRALGVRTLSGSEALSWTHSRFTRWNLLGAACFGTGWAVAGACPGPAAVQLAHGHFAALFILGGIFAGIWLSDLLPD